MATRFKLRSLVIVIAFLALALAVVVVSLENRRLRRELRQSQLQVEANAMHDRRLLLDLLGVIPASSPQPTRSAATNSKSDRADAATHSPTKH
jgi:hypothetical protein